MGFCHFDYGRPPIRRTDRSGGRPHGEISWDELLLYLAHLTRLRHPLLYRRGTRIEKLFKVTPLSLCLSPPAVPRHWRAGASSGGIEWPKGIFLPSAGTPSGNCFFKISTIFYSFYPNSAKASPPSVNLTLSPSPTRRGGVCLLMF